MRADVTGSPSCPFLEKVADNEAVAEKSCKWADVGRLEQLSRVCPTIPNFHILFCKVVRFSPGRSAAPPLPAILPEAASGALACTLRLSETEPTAISKSIASASWTCRITSDRMSFLNPDYAATFASPITAFDGSVTLPVTEAFVVCARSRLGWKHREMSSTEAGKLNMTSLRKRTWAARVSHSATSNPFLQL
jgi:hypothetical protein